MKIDLHIYETNYTLLVVVATSDDESVAAKDDFFEKFGKVM